MKQFTTLKEAMEAYSNISLKRICDETGCCYQYLLKASKKPIPNQIYDPSSFNYDEVETLIRKKVDFDTIDFESINDSIKVIEPLSKIDDFKVTTEFTLRNDDSTYIVLYITETHLVFMKQDDTQPRVMNISTFLHQGPRVANK